MEEAMGIWVALLAGVLPLVGLILWFWNDIWYAIPVRIRCIADGTKLPPGYMGIPFLGEMLTFLWYFKVLRCPDDFINSKRYKYGDEGMFRTHLFGSPAIIAYSPSLNKLVLQSSALFGQNWPSIELLGSESIVAADGAAHDRIKSFVVRAINQPDALQRVALMVQPRVISALHSWADKRRVVAYDEAKKLTFENIGKYFASFEPGPELDTLAELFVGFLKGVRAYPIKFPGTAYHHALQCRKKAMSIFKAEMEKRKKNWSSTTAKYDLMDGLMQFKDHEGRNLTDIEVLDNIVSLVVGGYESTALSIMWALFYLAKYPEVLNKLREENMPIVKNRKGDMITNDEISKLKYTNKVVEEIIRLANVSAFIFRIVNKDVEHKGYKIPKGWKVLCWIRYIHVNAENFEDPLTFNPDRWDDHPRPGTSLMFGGGKRICAGNMLARLQIAIFLHHLAVGYRWELINNDPEMSFLPHPKPADGLEIAISKI